MLKLIQRLPAVSQPRLFPRTVFSRTLYNQNGPVNIQRVRFTSPPKRRWFGGFTVKTLLYGTLGLAVLAILDDEDDEDEVTVRQVAEAVEGIQKEGEEAQLSKRNNEDDTYFIPLGLPYQLPKEYYKGSDPEWERFVQLSKNREQRERIKNNLAGLVGWCVGELPSLQQILGKEMIPRKFWIDIDYPEILPPEYEQRGLEITEEHIAWTTRPVDPFNYNLLHNALRPTPLVLSFWAGFRTMLSLQIAKLKGLSGISIGQETKNSDSMESTEEQFKRLFPRPSRDRQGSIPDGLDERSVSSSSESSNAENSSIRRQLPNDSGTLPLTSTSGVVGDLSIAIDVFKQTLGKTWKPAHKPVIKGSVLFSGLVEVVGPKGLAVFDVFALYHPADAEWVFVSISLRRVQEKNQSPKGGGLGILAKMPLETFKTLMALSPKELGELDCSPTQTPYQTRSTSPNRGRLMSHTVQDADVFMTRLHNLVPESKQAATGCIRISGQSQEWNETDHRIAFKAKIPDALHGQVLANSSSPTKDSLIRVGVLDGSAEVSTTTKVRLIVIYFIFNLSLTLYNKAVMNTFRYPFLLTTLHAAAGMVGTHIMLARGTFALKNLTRKDGYVLSAFSILYTANIAVSNVSLAMVTVPFHQTVRALTPVFTAAIYRYCFSGIYDKGTYISLAPVILGVMLASYGDLYASLLGFSMTLLGTLLAAVKTVATNRLQTAGLHFGALELLYRMSPIACVQSLVMAYLCGEIQQFRDFAAVPGQFRLQEVMILLINGAIAFALNVVSFETNRCAGALTMTIAANVKQVLTVVLSIMIWRIQVGSMNACGIVLTLIGGAWYGRVEVMSKGKDVTSAVKMEEGKAEKGEGSPPRGQS
ncbi:MAG: hypothetical protein Q9214_003580 [Letrouitia sp. 1 TL-2023]